MEVAPRIRPTKDTEGPIFQRTRLLPFLYRFYAQRLTRAGRWFFWPCVVAAAVASFSLNYQVYVPFSYATALWGLAFLTSWVFRPRARVTSVQPSRVCAGETFEVDVEVTRKKGGAALDLRVLPHRLPGAVDAVSEDGVPLPPSKPGQPVRVRVPLVARRRGAHLLRGYRVETDFPFGLVNSRRIFEEEKALLAYPRFTPLSQLRIPTGRRYQPGGVALASIVGESAEFVGDREYREGDNVRDIDWRATARLDRLIVREYRQEYFLRVAVVLDTHVARRSASARREDFERAVSLCAAVGDALAREEYVVDLFAAGPDLYHLVAGRSLAYLDQILDILACVEESPVEPFGKIEPELSENLSRISSVVCVMLDWDATRAAFVEGLRRQGVGVKVAVVRSAACTLPPEGGADVLIDAAAFAVGMREL